MVKEQKKQEKIDKKNKQFEAPDEDAEKAVKKMETSKNTVEETKTKKPVSGKPDIEELKKKFLKKK